MTESIKIYRKRNQRLGFEVEKTALVDLYLDEPTLNRLIEHINSQFLYCSNQQSEYLLKGTIDPNHSLITVFSILLILPMIKALWLLDFAYIFWQYCIIFGSAIYFTVGQFNRCDAMREKYQEAEQQLTEKFKNIQQDFNSRFDFLKMDYIRGINQMEEGYLEIKIFKPSTKALNCFLK